MSSLVTGPSLAPGPGLDERQVPPDSTRGSGMRQSPAAKTHLPPLGGATCSTKQSDTDLRRRQAPACTYACACACICSWLANGNVLWGRRMSIGCGVPVCFACLRRRRCVVQCDLCFGSTLLSLVYPCLGASLTSANRSMLNLCWVMYMIGTPGILRMRRFRSLSHVATM